MRGALTLIVALATVASSATAASAQEVSLSVENDDLYAGVPFVLVVSAKGFDQTPEPKVQPFSIPGAEIRYLGMSPNSMSSMRVINGVVSRSEEITFNYRYHVEVKQAGRREVPAITVQQGSKKASSQPARFDAGEISDSPDMRFSLGLPERPVWLGETFELTLDWYLRRDPREPRFVVPLFALDEWVKIEPPDGGKGEGTLPFAAGARQIDLPYTRSKETIDGQEYSRFSFRALVTPTRSGTLELPPAKVLAKLQTGVGRDDWGFRVARTEMFKAEDRARTLEVKAPPLTDRPDSFAGAVGSAFSIEMQASRTVVQVGQPIELSISIRGDAALDGVGLPKLDGQGGLSTELFDIPDELPPGEIVDGAKRFVVTVRLKGANAREIPPIAFSYFDPKTSRYQTVKSQPIALSVAGSAIVGAEQVVGGKKQPDPVSADGTGPGSLVGADLALSAESDTLRAPMSQATARWIALALAAISLAVFALRVWQMRTRADREEHGAIKRLRQAAEREIEAAAKSPGREAAPRIISALRALAKATEDRVPADLVVELENQAFDPRAATEPLAASLRDRARAAGAAMARRRRSPSAAGPATALLVLAVSLAPAAWGAGGDLGAARQAYRTALEQRDRDARTRGFAQAELAFRELVGAYPDRPELLTDWGNAALGARDLGRATLAYRRALFMDGSLERARRNLDWVRERAPAWLPRPAESGAIESLLFWHRALSRSQRILFGAGALALAVLLAAPWGSRRDRAMRRLALVPAVVAIAMALSVGFERDAGSDAVVVADGVVLRSADSAGAPPALSGPLPSGAEGSVIEIRDSWTRIQLADGKRGWVPAGTVERVVPSGS